MRLNGMNRMLADTIAALHWTAIVVAFYILLALSFGVLDSECGMMWGTNVANLRLPHWRRH